MRHLRLLLRRTPPRAHHVLRRRILEALALVAIVDAGGTILMWLFERDAGRGEIHNLWDAFFFTTVQLLTVSSQMRNPVTTAGRIVDIVLELTALFLVTAIAGVFASFFLNVGKDRGRLGGLRERRVGAHRVHVPRLHLLAAFGAGEARHHRRAAVLVRERHRLAVEMAGAPVHQREQDRVEIEAGLGQAVLVALRSLLVELTPQDSVRDEGVQPVAEDVAGHARVPLQLLEAADAEERLAEDEQRPPFADDRQRLADGTVRAAPFLTCHAHIVAFRNALV